jgi:outer membrane cobalamin receptor
MNYTFLDARNLSDEPNTYDKILVYRPKHSLNISVSSNWSVFTLKYDFQYIGQRYTNPANTLYLEAYQTSDLVLSARLHYQDWQPQLSFQIRNIFDEQYEIIRYQPIPGREFRFTIGILLN